MIIACYVRKPALTPILITLSAYQQAAVAIIDEIVIRRGLPWTTEVRHWVPDALNSAIQAAGPGDASTLNVDGTPVAVIRAEAVDIIAAAAERYITRRGLSGTVALIPGIAQSIKNVIDAAPHTAPL